MKHYIGTDIIEIARIRQTIERWGERFLNRVYTPAEQKLYDRRAHSLAACFAGKEAVMKALGTGVKGVSWKEIEILSKPTGEPLVRLYGKAKIVAASLGLAEFAVSLSHSREYAVASVIAQSRLNV